MAEVVVLRSGYAVTDASGKLRAGGTISLVSSAGVRIVVDTGGPSDRAALLDALGERALQADQVQYVVCTHGHADHVGNNNLFAGATFFIGRDRSVGDVFEDVDYASGPYAITPEVQVIATPGHTSEDLSVVVQTAGGVVALVGDLFEDAADAGADTWVQFSRDPGRQRRSRADILAIADFIVPGHGGRFAVREVC